MKYLLMFAVLFLTSCSSLKVVKECNEVNDSDDLYVCKTLGWFE